MPFLRFSLKILDSIESFPIEQSPSYHVNVHEVVYLSSLTKVDSAFPKVQLKNTR